MRAPCGTVALVFESSFGLQKPGNESVPRLLFVGGLTSNPSRVSSRVTRLSSLEILDPRPSSSKMAVCREVHLHDRVNTLCIGGGTHGNELHGVYLVKNWLKNDGHEIKRTSFRTHAVLSNPRATEKCVRFIDVDLNRQFKPQNLFPSEEEKDSCSYEVQRARELYAQFQGKTGEKAVDFWLDLHNTTANMGPCFIMSHKKSPFGLHIAAHVQTKFPDIRIMLLKGIFEGGQEMSSEFPTGSVSNIAKEGFALEMGPLPNGVLNATMYNLAKEIICSVLDAVEEFNNGKEFGEKEIEVFKFQGIIHYPTDEKGEISAMISPDLHGKDWKPLHPGDPLFLSFLGETMPFNGDHVVWPVFINEAAYFRNKIALSITTKEKIVIPALKVKQIQ